MKIIHLFSMGKKSAEKSFAAVQDVLSDLTLREISFGAIREKLEI